MTDEQIIKKFLNSFFDEGWYRGYPEKIEELYWSLFHADYPHDQIQELITGAITTVMNEYQ